MTTRMLLVLGVLLIGAGLLTAASEWLRSQLTERRLFTRLPPGGSGERGHEAAPGHPLATLARRLIRDPAGLRHSHPVRRQLVAAGYAREVDFYYYLVIRLALPIVTASGALALAHGGRWAIPAVCGGALLGILAPSWWLKARARRRGARAQQELILLVDLLRMLHGAGLGTGQSLLELADGFGNVLPTLTPELRVANHQFQCGRGRRETLEPLAALFQLPDFSSFAELVDRIERYGGAADEPLGRFAERLAEQYRLDLKTRIGRTTVKMTVVMVLFMLPSLLVLLAAPGMLSVLRFLASAHP
ncbi:type II secretion system F family protein [Chitiniphilus eburneus]|uniref:Type II secretion system F family protein n=1 Tax=Chitiniphilus eburneus TaxID=2571148 RepID=A0A4U0P517_9NEIS|nr:type II secretion system F family protein [Chitiniphilus eburneus]TJZ62443.1 type II secretion system F family protein [Chitiniphilus eburneus]